MGEDDVHCDFFSHFQINRPLSEGSQPSLDNGFNNFEDVRGESGTRVTITLSQAAIAAGFLNEKEFLVPLVTRILEKSPYRVAFEGCCSVEECDRIILANSREEMEIEYPTDHSDPLSVVDSSVHSGAIYFDTLTFQSYIFTLECGFVDIDQDSFTVKERSKFIPLRLSLNERKMLRLVEAAMICSDYTSKVDKVFKSSTRRIHTQLKGITSILRGLIIACDDHSGKIPADDADFRESEEFIQKIFEIARRHKIMNPEKMRTEYGKQERNSSFVRFNYCLSYLKTV
jgi:hypothetical protein